MYNNPYPGEINDLSSVQKDVLAVLGYFDLFSYPLTCAEVNLFLGSKNDSRVVSAALDYLVNSEKIYLFDCCYTLKKDSRIVSRRKAGNKRAAELMKVAEKICAFLIRLPYVKGIAVSGSLSKNFADEDSDIDLFVITAKNRLWIARTCMHAFKKLAFLFKKQHYFCMNYYIDETCLEIPEKNIYTATEVATLIPLQGDLAFKQFYAANTWVLKFLPNKIMRIDLARPVKQRFFKELFEKLFNNKTGDALDSALMNITTRRWQQKTLLKKLNGHGEVMAMAAGKHFSKPEPANFQRGLLSRYHQKISTLFSRHAVPL